MVDIFSQTETWAIKGKCPFEMDVDYGGSINKYILSAYCVPSSVIPYRG